MKIKLTKTLHMLMALPIAALIIGAVVTPAYAADLSLAGGSQAAQGTDQEGNAGCLFGTEAGCSGDGLFKKITNVLLFIIGAVSVIMLVIGGIRYTISSGDQNQVTAAKNTILYAIVGIVVELLAYAIVNFVISSFKS
jgi:uncharacterized membrane protein